MISPRKFAVAAACYMIMSTATFSQTTLPLAVPFTEADASSGHAATWAADIAERTDGSVIIEPVYNGALVSIPSTLDAVADLVVPMGMTGASYLSGAIPAFGYTELMGGMPSESPLTEDALSQLWPLMEEALVPYGVVPLWGESGGSAGPVCRDGHIAELADWEGVTVRVAGRWQAAQIEALGGLPVQTSFAELYLALQNGTVDCALMVPSLAVSLRLFEVAPYYTNYRIASNIIMTLANAEELARLTDDERAAVRAASVQATQTGSLNLRNVMASALETYAANGGDVLDVTDEQRAAFLDASAEVFEEAVRSAGPGAELAEALHGFRTN